MSFELWTKLSLQDLDKEHNPWSDLARLQKVFAHNNLVAHEENLTDQGHCHDIVLTGLETIVGENTALDHWEKHANNCLKGLSVSADLEFES